MDYYSYHTELEFMRIMYICLSGNYTRVEEEIRAKDNEEIIGLIGTADMFFNNYTNNGTNLQQEYWVLHPQHYKLSQYVNESLRNAKTPLNGC